MWSQYSKEEKQDQDTVVILSNVNWQCNAGRVFPFSVRVRGPHS